MQFHKAFFITLMGGLLAIVSNISFAGYRLKILTPEQFEYGTGLGGLSGQGVVSFSVDESKMSVDIKNATLGYVLQEFSRVTGVDVHLPEFRAQEPVSLKFENLPLQKALQRIMGENYTLTFNALTEKDDLSIADLSNIRLVNNHEVARKINANKRIEFDSDILIEQSLLNGNNKERILALEALKLNGGKISGDLIRALLSDDSPQVRQLALKQAVSHFGNDQVTGMLNSLASNSSFNPASRAFAETALVTLNNGASSTTNDESQIKSSAPENNQNSIKNNNKDDTKSDLPSSTSDPVELAKLALQNGDDQAALDALRDIRRQNLNVDLDVLKEFASDSSISNDTRQMALEAATNRMHPVEAKAFLLQKIDSETDPGVKGQYEYQLSKVVRNADLLYRIKL